MSGVDVLAVMDRLGTGTVTRHEIDATRAAVAELIEAAQALPSPRGAQVITFEGADYVLLAPEDHEALCSALSRVTGGSDGR